MNESFILLLESIQMKDEKKSSYYKDSMQE